MKLTVKDWLIALGPAAVLVALVIVLEWKAYP